MRTNRVRLRHRRAGVLVASLALLATGFGGTAVAAGDTGEARADAARQPHRGGTAGDVVKARATTFLPAPGQAADVTAWKVHYRSTTATGRPTVVSGTVLIPDDGAGPAGSPRPLVSYAVGTVGMGDQCAPSATFPTGQTAEGALIAMLLERGWAVAVTDYEGLGTPGTHTYTVGRSAGHAVLDIARAAQRLPGAAERGVTAGSPVGLMGYSQGGQAVGWAAQLHAAYAPDLDVRGTAAGGVPARLATGHSPGGLGATFHMMTLIGHGAAYPELNLASYLNRDGRALAARLSRGCLAENIEAGSRYDFSELVVRDPGKSSAWQRRLGESAVGGIAPGSPVFLYHGLADDLVVPALGEGLRDDWCRLGADVHWLGLPGADHLMAVPAAHRPAADWLAGRFAGTPAAGTCA
ncbi:lipase family protein [Streptomyces sodiiphilus]|uniref:Lipase family protein n=1 Tax=Streptomyces sodiiphilus TaxID=226217 RepID=A0ABP5A9E3_9ACTN